MTKWLVQSKRNAFNRIGKSMSPIEDLLDDLIGKYARMKDTVEVYFNDDDLLLDLRKQLDTLLDSRNEPLSMEVYTFVVMRAFRTLRGD